MQHQGGLARPVGPQHGNTFTLLDHQIDSVESRRPVRVRVAQVGDGHGCHRAHPHEASASTATVAGRASATTQSRPVTEAALPRSGRWPAYPRLTMAR